MKKPIEIGMRVEFVLGCTHYEGRVLEEIPCVYGGGYKIEAPERPEKVIEVHRRQITKVWRKKPKKLVWDCEPIEIAHPCANELIIPATVEELKPYYGKSLRITIEALDD